jgi:hypothetical protein
MAPLAKQDHKDHKDHKEYKAQLDHKDPLDHKDQWEPLGQLRQLCSTSAVPTT